MIIGGEDISRHIFNRTFIFIPGIRFAGSYFCRYIIYSDIFQSSFFPTDTFAYSQKNNIASIQNLQAVGFYIFNKSTIHCFQRNGRTIGVKYFILYYPDISETSQRSRSKLNSIGAGTNGTIPDQDILTNTFWVMRFQANAIICRINIRIGYSYTVAIHNINSIIVPERPAVNSDTVDRRFLH